MDGSNKWCSRRDLGGNVGTKYQSVCSAPVWEAVCSTASTCRILFYSSSRPLSKAFSKSISNRLDSVWCCFRAKRSNCATAAPRHCNGTSGLSGSVSGYALYSQESVMEFWQCDPIFCASITRHRLVYPPAEKDMANVSKQFLAPQLQPRASHPQLWLPIRGSKFLLIRTDTSHEAAKEATFTIPPRHRRVRGCRIVIRLPVSVTQGANRAERS